jgi:predicted nucleic acid-binding protein
MILVDTSVWIDHLRASDAHLSTLLSQANVVMHPMVLGELACGNLQDRRTLIALWRNLPQLAAVTDAEALYFLDQNRLWGRGIGYIDLHLLAAVALSAQARLWTRDKRLRKTAQQIGLAYPEP